MYSDDIKKIKTFCILPWIHSYIKPNGEVRPCSTSIVNSKSLGWQKQKVTKVKSIGDIKNSFNYKQLRMQMLNNEIPTSCISCFKSEYNKIDSKRTRNNKYWSKKLDFNKIIKNTKADGTVTEGLKSLEWSLGNKCNQMCIMCSGHNSTMWLDKLSSYQKEIKNKNLNDNFDWKLADIIPDWPSLNKDLINYLEKELLSIEEIFFDGGDPLLANDQEIILKKCVELNVSKKINLTYCLFNSKITKDLVRHWKEFKSLNIIYSLDGIGDENDYIRYPSKWTDVLDNITKIRELEVPEKEIKFQITVNALNILAVPRIIKFLHEEFEINNSDIIISKVKKPEHLNVQIFNLKQKKIIEENFEEFYIWLKKKGLSSSKFKKIIKFMNSSSQSENFPAFVEYLKIIDSKREKSYKIIFPKMSSLLEN